MVYTEVAAYRRPRVKLVLGKTLREKAGAQFRSLRQPAFRAFRGNDWMQEPCRSCPRKEQDFGGCRCQAFLITGDARAADPVCHLSPHHGEMEALAAQEANSAYEYRRLIRS